MDKFLKFKLEETAGFFSSMERTENETYLLDVLLDICREYNKLVDEYNILANRNELLCSIISSSPDKNHSYRKREKL